MKRYNVNSKKRRAVFHKTDGKCFYCGSSLLEEDILDDNGKSVSSNPLWHVHHVIPLSQGGDYSMENLVATCFGCHGKDKHGGKK